MSEKFIAMAYAVKDRAGVLAIWQIAITEDDAINKFLDRANGLGRHHKWTHFLNQGFSVVEISIQESTSDQLDK